MAASDETFEERLTRLRNVTGWIALIGPYLFGAFGVGIGIYCGLRVPIAIGLFFLLHGWVTSSLRSMLKWRQRAHATLLANPRSVVPRVPLFTRVMPYLAGLLVIALATYGLWSGVAPEIWGPWPTLGEPDSDSAEAQLYGWVFLLVAILSALFAQYFANVSEEVAPEASGLSNWFRAGTWMALAGAASLFVRAFATPWREALTANVLLGLVAFLAAELVFQAAWTSALRRFEGIPHPGARIATNLLSLRILCSRFNPSASFFSVLANVFGMDLRGAWALTFLRRSIEPLAVGLIVVGWLSTSFVMIQGPELGLLERFGKRTDAPLEPGLHLVLPWPMSRVTRVPIHRVQTIPIGFTGGRADASVLWTVEHAEEEYKLLLGNGRDLITINASLHYRVKDPIAYAYAQQNPDESLAILADRVLMQRTVGLSLDEALSENLAILGTELEAEIQKASDDHDLGFEIVDLSLYGLHPPVNVAAAYQAVVAAKVDQTTRVLEAEAYRATEKPKADGEAARLGNEARTHRATRLATARGEATAFESLEASYDVSPEAFRLVHYLKGMEAQLTDRKLTVLDHTIEEAGAAIWLLE